MKHTPGLLQKLFVVSVLGISLFALGCKREAPTPVQPPVEPQVESASVSEIDAIAVVENSPADSITAMSKGFDSKSFAGKFRGTLPCANCPGIDASVELNADGNFMLVETSQGEAEGPKNIDGTWTVEGDGKQLRLDPSSKTDADRVFTIVGNDEIQLLAEDGKPVAGLKREAARQ